MRLSDERLAQILLWNEARGKHALWQPGKKEMAALIAEVRALRPCEKAAEDFVAKVDSGRARSVDSYGKFAAALAGVRALEDR